MFQMQYSHENSIETPMNRTPGAWTPMVMERNDTKKNSVSHVSPFNLEINQSFIPQPPLKPT